MKKILLLILFLIIGSVRTQGEAIVQAEFVKAAFIFHFISFTEWGDNESDYFVCIPQDKALQTAAQESLDAKVINNRTIHVVQRQSDCHVLVSDEISSEVDDTLTIGSLSKGAMLEFRVVENKLKFAVNPERIKKSKLKISSQLLKLAILEEAS